MIGFKLKRARLEAGIPGHFVCQRSEIGRSRLSDIERGYVKPTQSEIRRIQNAIEELSRTRQKVAQFAETVGWPL